MIQLTAHQEKRAMGRDCRVWMELMAEAWYGSDNPYSERYPAEQLVSDLYAGYFYCRLNGVKNIQQISYIGFAFLRAKALDCPKADIEAIVDYFCQQVRADNVVFAQQWIDIYLERII